MNHQSSSAYLEHSNLTVKDPKGTAAILCRLFGWTIRWQGPAKDDGYTIHVGGEHSYLALYSHDDTVEQTTNYLTLGKLNHLGIVVSDLDALETKVKAEGFVAFNHGDYEPGRRFYFMLDELLEIEVVSYQPARVSSKTSGPSVQALQYRYHYK